MTWGRAHTALSPLSGLSSQAVGETEAQGCTGAAQKLLRLRVPQSRPQSRWVGVLPTWGALSGAPKHRGTTIPKPRPGGRAVTRCQAW